MEELWSIVSRATGFFSVYLMIKCIKSMLVMTIMVLPVLLIRKCNRRQSAVVNVFAVLLLIPAAFTGMSKLFYTGSLWKISNFLVETTKPVYGYFYFGVVLVQLAVLLVRTAYDRSRIKGLPLFGETDIQKEIVEIFCAGDRTLLFAGYLSRVQIRVTAQRISPYAGGLLRPYVVIPFEMASSWEREDKKAVIAHELYHIRAGHLWLLALFKLLCIYWWINPLIYFCEMLLKDDLEMACDESCLRLMHIGRKQYGRLLLETLAMVQSKAERVTKEALSFLGRRGFPFLRKRIRHLNGMCFSEGFGPGRRRMIFSGTLAFTLLTALVLLTSYPRYTRMRELVLFDEELEMIDCDSEQLRSAVRVEDGRLVIEEEGFRELLRDRGLMDKYVYISFDVIMKVPGIGGGGNVGMVATADFDDILYLGAGASENRVLEFFLKYI